jgi:hypothetical protein
MQVADTSNLGTYYPLLLQPNAGNVGIGTSSPSTKLQVEDGFISTYHNINANGAGYGIQFYTNGGGSKNTIAEIGISQVGTARSGDMIFNTSNSGAPSTKMTITSGGEVCVNRTSGSGKFNIDGAFYMYNMTAGAGLSTLKYHTGTGEVTYDTSARIFKKDIVDLEYGLDSVLKMNPKKYKWKSNNEQDLGFIADEMHQVIPEIVFLADNKANKTELQDGEPMGINYDRLIPVLVNAIQELEARIKQLENK